MRIWQRDTFPSDSKGLLCLLSFQNLLNAEYATTFFLGKSISVELHWCCFLNQWSASPTWVILLWEAVHKKTFYCCLLVINFLFNIAGGLHNLYLQQLVIVNLFFSWQFFFLLCKLPLRRLWQHISSFLKWIEYRLISHFLMQNRCLPGLSSDIAGSSCNSLTFYSLFQSVLPRSFTLTVKVPRLFFWLFSISKEASSQSV